MKMVHFDISTNEDSVTSKPEGNPRVDQTIATKEWAPHAYWKQLETKPASRL